jgi:hypothetical protein
MLIRFWKTFSRTIFGCALLCLLLIFSCSTTPLPRGGSFTIPEDFFGMVHAGKYRTPEEFQLIDEMGIKWILATFYWADIESEKGYFDFSEYDVLVNEAIDEGKKIVAVLAYETFWLYPNKKSKARISAEQLPDFLNYVEETVLHFQGRVDIWEIWNEPNNIMFWKGSAQEYYELTRQTAQRIREIDPEAYILGGAFWRTPTGFIRNMHKANAMENLDGIAFHPYGLDPIGSMRLYDNFLKVLAEINYTGPVWVTEAGYPTGGFYPIRISMELLPSYVIKTIVGSAARGARVVLWYELFDAQNEGETSLDTWNIGLFYGLTYPDYTRKNGAWAYELCARFLPGSRYTPELPVRQNISSSIVSFCFLDGTSGNNTLILWNDGILSQRVRLSLPGTVLLHDISTGISSPLSGETILDVEKQPLFITWQGTGIPRLSRAN